MEQDTKNYLLMLGRALKYWYIYAATLMVFGFAAYFYLKYKHPMYTSSIKILIEDEKDSRRLSEEVIFSDLGFGKVSNNLPNEMSILGSSPMLSRVVEKLELRFRYYTIDGYKKREIYKAVTPVEVLLWEPNPGSYDGFYGVLTANTDGTYALKIPDESLGKNNIFSGEFGKNLEVPGGTIAISSKSNLSDFDEIGVWIMPPGEMALNLMSKIIIEQVQDKSSIVEITMKDETPQRIFDVLTTLVEVYNQNSIDKKNQVFKNTIDLINTRIEMIAQELSAAEQDVQSYKQRFSMTELSSEGTMLMTELSGYEKQIAGTETQLEILSYIEEFLEKNRNTFEFVPTNATLTDLTLVNQIGSFNKLLSEREEQRGKLGPAHSNLAVIDKQLRNLRETIISSVRSIKKDLTITLNSNQGVKGNLQTRIQTLPRRERELVEIERRKNLKENLYLYLLQKREESAISLSITTAKSQLVEPAGVPRLPSSPNRPQIWLIVIFMGFALPTGAVFLIYALNDKLRPEDDVERATGVAVAGAIAHSRLKGTRLVVKEKSRSITTETFRLLRANLSYIASGNEVKTVLVTSGISGEGKSFMALNLGLIEAMANKRVVILDLDLRKPRQELYNSARAMDTEVGVVNYLVDPELCVEDVIENSGAHPNLDIIRCGPKPPNPGELILSGRLRELVLVLSSRYDLIILDAPPVGLVADPLQMKDLADITLFVLRMGYSRKGELNLVKDIAEKNKLPRPFIVLNDLKTDNNSGFSYGNSYGYGYGSGSGYYDEDEDQPKWWQVWRKKKPAEKPVATADQQDKNGAGKAKRQAASNSNGNYKKQADKTKQRYH